MRHHLYSFLSEVQTAMETRASRGGVNKVNNSKENGKIGRFSDKNLIVWANEVISGVVQMRGYPEFAEEKLDLRDRGRIKTFRDKHLTDSIFFLLLIWVIQVLHNDCFTSF